MILLTALYTVAGGIYVRGNLRGSPGLNTAILAIGALLASFMGTTGASMLLIRPLLRANDNRRHQAHVVVFFIFIVSNAGGSDAARRSAAVPGISEGVDFFWTVSHIWGPMLFLTLALLAVFYVLDHRLMGHKGETDLPDPTPSMDATGARSRLGFEGRVNFVLLMVVVALVLVSGIWRTPAGFEIAGTHVGLPGLVRDLGLLAVALLSLKLTPARVHRANEFGWGPCRKWPSCSQVSS